jgi:DNA-binding IscR family transcriptional regulator
VAGQPGPGGGYTLARPAAEISLYDIVRVFEQIEGPSPCPFGTGWCGHGDPCPLHHKIIEVRQQNEDFLRLTTLEVFLGAYPRRAS